MFCWFATLACNNTGFDLPSMNEHKVREQKDVALYLSYVSLNLYLAGNKSNVDTRVE